MLYQNADDNALERDIMIDLNEAEMIGSTDQVMIVSQMDRFRAATVVMEIGPPPDVTWSPMIMTSTGLAQI
jgi:hypothetical protein